MAKQNSIFKLKGLLDDVSFLHTQDGHLAKKKTSVDAARIASDPTFINVRRNNTEFGRAGKAGKLFRSTFQAQLDQVSDNRVISRLQKIMMDVIHSDFTPGHGYGDRLIADGNMLLLQDFNCNIHSQLTATIAAPFTAGFDRPAGQATIDITAFTPVLSLRAPGGTTHFKIFSAAGEIDFAGETSKFAASETPLTLWDNTVQPPITLQNALTPAGTLPVFILLGIQFFKVVNGIPGILNTEASEALVVVKVDTP